MVNNFPLSKHFSFYELTNTSYFSQLEANRKEGLDKEFVFKELCEKLLEPIREHFGKPIIINSGYRGKTLNQIIGGVTTSQHCYGEASDIVIDDINPIEILEFVRATPSINQYVSQIIDEHNSSSSWCHIALRTHRWIDYKGMDQCQYMRYQNGQYTNI